MNDYLSYPKGISCVKNPFPGTPTASIAVRQLRREGRQTWMSSAKILKNETPFMI